MVDCCDTNCCEPSIDELKKTIDCQNQQICELKRKLELSNDMANQRNELFQLCDELERWKKEKENCYADLSKELYSKIEEETQRRMAEEKLWQEKYAQQQNENGCLANQLSALKTTECKLKSLLEETSENLKCIQKKSCKTEAELEDKNCTLKQLENKLSDKDKELCQTREVLNEYSTEIDRLKDLYCSLERELNCMKAKCCCPSIPPPCGNLPCGNPPCGIPPCGNPPCGIPPCGNPPCGIPPCGNPPCGKPPCEIGSCAEEKLKIELETLACELKTKSKKLIRVESQYDEATRKLNDAKWKIEKLVASIVELKEESLKSHNKMKALIQKLKEENCSKEDENCCLKKNVKKLQRDNEFKTMEINTQKNTICEKESQLKRFKELTDKIGQMKEKYQSCCCSQSKTAQTCGCSSTVSSVECCSSSNDVQRIIQKYAPKTNDSNNNCKCAKSELLKNLCELEDLKKDVCQISGKI